MKKFAMVMLVCAMALSGCGSNSDTPKDGEPVQDSQVANDDNAAASPIQVTLNGTTTTKEDKWDELKEGKELLLVDVTLQNNTEETYDFNPNYVYIEVENEKVSCSDLLPAEGETLGSCSLEAGKNTSGIIPFEIEEGTTDYKIYFDDVDNQFEVK
ncbi:DUF4352 domain-containing protein [Anaerotignum propionicum]|uniref:Telomeric repeat-binding factor 2 n=1 Tax=Anaerotignum propionicum DSM 1682 TaxID=991789 RepID=A0A0X1U6W6_ANAPI|nr:DUF4352 domain-containing protein [Anaerotignum propionicum]AMJ40671.1 telomeric repeat-binding factor 2 [Anaerotignum propionicum DSM 1682]SHE90448.1 protein of unknown function [[Clostridium] propionicum DSM 1682] [Anaerotignum propionicum DSM 1682]